MKKLGLGVGIVILALVIAASMGPICKKETVSDKDIDNAVRYNYEQCIRVKFPEAKCSEVARQTRVYKELERERIEARCVEEPF